MPVFTLANNGLPADGCFAARGQIGIGLREGTRTEEAAVGRKGGGVRGGENAMARAVDECGFATGISAPKQEDDPFAPDGEGANDGIGEGFPTLSLMRSGGSGAHR